MTETAISGWCPWAIAKPLSPHKYWRGNKGRDAIVLHSLETSIELAIKVFSGEAHQSAHFAIDKNGLLYQFISVHNSALANGASFYNGQWFDASNRAIATPWLKSHAQSNPNWRTISICYTECENNSNPLVRETSLRLLDWLSSVYPHLSPYIPSQTLIEYRDINPIDSKNDLNARLEVMRLAAAANRNVTNTIGLEKLSATSLIVAPPRAYVDQATHYMLEHEHGMYSEADIAENILPAYWETCQQAGIDPLIAVAHMIYETNNLTSWWSQRNRCNPANIGVTGERGVGLSFPSWRYDAIPAHIGRLLAYAMQDEQCNPTQRGLVATALHWQSLPHHYRGTAPSLSGLEGRWSNQKQFQVEGIIEIAQTIARQYIFI